jgi:hypothetical protein
MRHAMRDHREMDVWKLADEVRRRVVELTGRPVFREHARFLVIAKSSLTEIIEHLDDVRQLGLAPVDEITQIVVLARRARGAATGLIRYLSKATVPI